MFTTKQSYASHVPDGRTYSVDALEAHWGGTWADAYPPHALLPKILPANRRMPKQHSVAGIPSPVGNIMSSCMDSLSNPSRIKHFLRRLFRASQHPSKMLWICHSKKSIFSLWCNQRQINLLTVNVQQIAAFLFEKQKGADSYYISTLKYKSKLDISNSIYLTALLKNIVDNVKTKHQQQHIYPLWSDGSPDYTTSR